MNFLRHGGRLALLAVAVVMLVPGAASAATPSATVTGNPDCADLNQSWTELKVDRQPEATTYSDGTLSVTFSNLDGNKAFDWASNIGVDAVIVKAGTQSYIYSYSPEATADTAVGSKGQAAISHVSFCYDTNDAPPPPPNPCGNSDMDGDGVNDACDICPNVENPGQEDSDGDGMGDACEPAPPTCAEQNANSPDSDGDGIVDACDNCPATMNADQADADGDGQGDACEPTSPVVTTTSAPEQQQTATEQPATEQPASGPAAEQPTQLVLGERVSAPSARLLAPTGCVGRSFTAGVRGTQIARVVFLLDGKRVKTVTKRNARGLYALRVNPKNLRVGVHRLVVRVTYGAGSPVRSKTLRASFQRCARQLVAPRFTG